MLQLIESLRRGFVVMCVNGLPVECYWHVKALLVLVCPALAHVRASSTLL